MSFFEKVYTVVEKVPCGMVTTYGTVARLAGSPRAFRQVGWALHCNPRPGEIPCHRVVFADGAVSPGFAFGGPEIQRAMLESEGVKFTNDGKVDMCKHFWEGN